MCIKRGLGLLGRKLKKEGKGKKRGGDSDELAIGQIIKQPIRGGVVVVLYNSVYVW